MLVNVVSENVMSVIRGLMLPPFTLDMAFFMSGCIKVIHGDALLRVAVFQCQHLSCRQDSCVEPEAFSHRKRVCLSSPFPLPSHQLSTVHHLKTVQSVGMLDTTLDNLIRGGCRACKLLRADADVRSH